MIDLTDSNAVYYYHFDGLGSVVALTDANGPPLADPDPRLGVGQAVARYDCSVLYACGVLRARGGKTTNYTDYLCESAVRHPGDFLNR